MSKFKLPKEFTETKFIPALRSGAYKQGDGRLYRAQEDTFCCLGVAAHLCRVPLILLDNQGYLFSKPERYSGPEETKRQQDLVDSAIAHGYPQELIATFVADTDTIDEQTLAATLASMNDEHIPFEDIADWIETNVELY